MRLLEILPLLSNCPAMYVGDVTIERVDAFLVGLIFRDDDDRDNSTYLKFQSWVHDLYKDDSTEAWWKLVKRHYPDTESSNKECFRLINEFVLRDSWEMTARCENSAHCP